MIQRDYILRLIADLANFLGRLLHLKKEQLPLAFDEAIAKIELLYGVSFSEFLALDNHELLKSEWPIAADLADALAELLAQMAQMAADLERYEYREVLLQKALFLYLQAQEKERSYKFERIVAINQIKEQLGVE